MEENISEEIKRLTPFLGKDRAAQLEVAFLLGNEKYRQKIMEAIDRIKAFIASDEELRESPLLEPPSQEEISKGEIELGKVLYGKKELYPLFISKKDLLTHVGIFGSSGSGKTNIVHYLIKSLAFQNIPMLVFDFSKRNYRDLLTLPEIKDRIIVYTVGREVVPFRFNPLLPPEGVSVVQWMKEFAEIFDHAYWLLGGGRYVILKALNEIYSKVEIPRLFDVKKWLENYSAVAISPREKNWLATAMRPLESLCLRETGKIFDCDKGILPSSFFEDRKITILELDALSSDDKTFLIEIILQWIRDWLIVKNVREKLVGVIVLEESHHVLNREKTKKLGIEAVTDLIFREIRELGIGIVYTDQHPSLVSYPALGNTSTHIYMNLGLDTKYSSDIEDAASMLGLKDEKDVSYLRRLPTGHAFMLIRKSAFPNPFLVKFPLILEERGKVSDEELRKLMQDKLLEIVENKRGKRFEALIVEEKMKKVTSTGWRILEALLDGCGVYTSELAKALRMSCKSFKEEVLKLVSLGLVGFKEAKAYKQKAFCYFLTHEGELALALKTGKLQEDLDIEGFEEEAAEFLSRKGYKVLEKRKKELIVEKDGIQQRILLAKTKNLNKLFEILKENFEEEMYFVCASKKIEKCLLQQATKYSVNHRQSFIIFYTNPEEIENGFKKLEFTV
jgi:hypothetical protein